MIYSSFMSRMLRCMCALTLFTLLVPAASGATTRPGQTRRTAALGATTRPVRPRASTATTATAHPATGSLRLYLRGVFFVKHHAVTVPGRGLHVGGVVRPFVSGQWVTVRVFLGGRLVKSDRLRIRRSRNGTYGHFSEYLASPGTGEMTVLVRHQRTSTLDGIRGRRYLEVLEKHVGFGSTGRFVQLVQQRLAALHIYTPQSGVYDQGTGLALDAYHRLLGWGTSQTIDARTTSFLLDGWGQFKVRYPRHGTHAEGDLRDQLLALIHGSRVDWIYPISSGKPSTPTVLGNFRVYSRVPGYLPDGMYDSDFFYGGYAIHGYDPAPDYPASHGCIRLPITDASSVFDWLRYGDGVDVYY